jgi:hypothetical protein
LYRFILGQPFHTQRYDLLVAGGMLVAVGGRGWDLLWGQDETARALNSASGFAMNSYAGMRKKLPLCKGFLL